MRFSNFIIKHRLWVVITFAVLTILSTVAIFFVNVNYDSTTYMPKDSDLSNGLEVMYDEFDDRGVAQVMAKDLKYDQIIALKNQISEIDGVSEVMWMDGMLDKAMDQFILPFFSSITKDKALLTKSIFVWAGIFPKSDITSKERPTYQKIENKINSMGGASFKPIMDQLKPQLEMFYIGNINEETGEFKTGNAMLQVFFETPKDGGKSDYSEKTFKAVDEIKHLKTETYLVGNPAIVYNSRKTIEKQTLIALGVAAVIVIAILFATSSSYFEPVLFLLAIGVAVLLNMGTNIILPSISYMTVSVAGVLQLALTMDYSIFLLHRFKMEKKNGRSVEQAMAFALKHSFSPISASSMTTVVSFIAIMFMSYTIGLDLGLVLAKGVIFSLLSVFLLLPAMVVYSHKLIEKSEHKTFELKFTGHSKFLYKTRFILPVLILALIIPCAYFQGQNDFTYGNGATFGGKSSIIYNDRVAIEEVFGRQNQVALILPKEKSEEFNAKEPEILEYLNSDEMKNEVISAQGISMITDFQDFLPSNIIGQFKSKSGNYTRVIIFLNVEEESKETTAAINKIQRYLDEQVEGYCLIGESPSALEIKNVVEKDYTIITIISIVLVALIIAITFKSILLPFILVATIEGAIWMGMTIPLLMNTPLVFIGYLIVNAILLGTTIDYAILLTNNYMHARSKYMKQQAMQIALQESGKTIITSAGIFTLIGFAVLLVSTMPAIKVFGLLIGFGGLMAMLTVLILLPQLLVIFDKLIQKTSIIKPKFANKISEPPAYAEATASDESVETAENETAEDNTIIADIDNTDTTN